MSPFCKEGKDICIFAFPPALLCDEFVNIAKDILAEKYPERKIYIVDSLSASSGYGLLMDTITGCRDGNRPSCANGWRQNKSRGGTGSLDFDVLHQGRQEPQVCRHNATYSSVAACEL
ncbi:MAG: hypothetical protein V8Q32_01570 [Anaerotignum faecicola]